MLVKTFNYQISKGWSLDKFPALDSPRTLILAFCSPEFIHHPGPINELLKAYPHSHFAGCSTAGEIFQDRIHDNSISVAVIKFETTDIHITTGEIHEPELSTALGKKMAKQLLEQQSELKAVIILSDGIKVNGSQLVQGFKEVLANNVIITGGLAGDGKDFKQTWVFDQNRPVPSVVTAIGLYGNRLEVTYGSKGGWDIFGPERLMTRSKNNILYEIDGQPALTLYKKYLGERADGLPATGLLFPLAISEHPFSDKQVVRTILGIDEQTQSMIFAGDMPQGWYAQLMKANFDRLIEGASMAGKLAQTQKDTPNALTLAISCVGRRLVLGERAEEEVDAILDIIGDNSSLVGFYSYGEISPSGLGSCDLHNQTMTITRIGER